MSSSIRIITSGSHLFALSIQWKRLIVLVPTAVGVLDVLRISESMIWVLRVRISLGVNVAPALALAMALTENEPSLSGGASKGMGGFRRTMTLNWTGT